MIDISEKKRGGGRRLLFSLLVAIWTIKTIAGITDLFGRRVPHYSDAVHAWPSVLGRVEMSLLIPVLFIALNIALSFFAGNIARPVAIVFAILIP